MKVMEGNEIERKVHERFDFSNVKSIKACCTGRETNGRRYNRTEV